MSVSDISYAFLLFFIKRNLFLKFVKNNINIKHIVLDEDTLTSFYDALTDFDFICTVNNTDHKCRSPKCNEFN